MRRKMFVFYLNLGDCGPGPGIAVNFVIDDSGSMNGRPIEEVREALRTVVQEAPEGSRLGLIAFGSEVRVFAEPTEYREFLLDQVERFEGKSGATMLWDAIGEACVRFEDDSRQRYVLVLTDGGDTGSLHFDLAGTDTKQSLVEHATANRVQVYSVGFGEVDSTCLERLSDTTGGRYLDARNVSSIIESLKQAMREILADRKVVRLRREFTRLVQGSCPGDQPWLRQVSIDPWSETELWSDANHVRFPAGGATSIADYSVTWTTIRDEVTTLLETLVRDQAHAQGFPPDVDVLVAGWLDDPVFRAMSPYVLEIFGEVRQRFGANLPDAMFPVLLPLVHEAGNFESQVAAESYAWLHAVWNHGGTTVPKAVLVIGDSNQHRRYNPHGHSGYARDRVLFGAANVMHSLALNPELVAEVVGYPQEGGCFLRSIGAVTVDAGHGQAHNSITYASLSYLVNGFCTRNVSESAGLDDARRRFRDENLDVAAVKAVLLSPLESGTPESILASIRLDHTTFWPPTRNVDVNDYIEILPNLIEERGTEYLYRKLEALRRVLSARSRQVLESTTQGVKEDVDSQLFGSGEGCIPGAHRYLEHLWLLLDEEAHRIEEGRIAGDLEVARIFGPDEQAVQTFGKLDRESARKVLEERIRNRPVLEALAIRFGLLALCGGVIVQAMVGGLGSTGSTLGPLGTPHIASLAIGAAFGVVGLVRWYLSRKRLETSIREYIGALVREARTAAVRACVAELRGLYAQLTDLLGKSEELPPLVLDKGRDETQLSERQRLTALGEHLAESMHLLKRRIHENASPENPLVWEVGTTFMNPLGSPPKLSLRRVDAAPESTLKWMEVSPKAQSGRWREVCRRRRCDELATYVAWHKERLNLPRRLWENAQNAARTLQESQLRIGYVLSPVILPDLGRVIEAMDVASFASLRIADTDSGLHVNRCWLASTGEFNRLAGQIDGVRSTPLVEAPQRDIAPTWQLHRVTMLEAPIGETVEWSGFLRAWWTTDEASRDAMLKTWGDSPTWKDPATGEPLRRQGKNERAAGSSDDEEGLL